MELVIALAVMVILFFIVLMRRKERISEADRHTSQKQEEKTAFNENKYVTYGQVQEVLSVINKEIKEKIDDEEKRNLMMEMANEWAEMKISSFQSKRSWLRTPKEHHVATDIEQVHGKQIR
ncbi:MAG: hypothetical protein P9L92_07375 [Candidatus Electryonea clarkiae]|nr:hypothetical protein [Candidatus Electryonea clarkiae]MDP8287828.1 hypothetical protein [Candidatus Electryonea clarkiae]